MDTTPGKCLSASDRATFVVKLTTCITVLQNRPEAQLLKPDWVPSFESYVIGLGLGLGLGFWSFLAPTFFISALQYALSCQLGPLKRGRSEKSRTTHFVSHSYRGSENAESLRSVSV